MSPWADPETIAGGWRGLPGPPVRVTESQLKTSRPEWEPSAVVRGEALQINLLGKDMDDLYRSSLVFIQPRVPFIPTRSVALIPIDMYPWAIEEPETMFVG
ncbi:hypothetical protein H2200_000844 [Cladophialophora chaetospira]|uniref:Uncharacterized protein n=1 Tax=Cladophialophora chaetospira TaxID=386627 RepID=A0AA39CRD3_9EURO|nr:hypothetical protein H2200_000844 [Cladophialophora chaetospira]